MSRKREVWNRGEGRDIGLVSSTGLQRAGSRETLAEQVGVENCHFELILRATETYHNYT